MYVPPKNIEQIVQSLLDTSFLFCVSILEATPNHIPHKYRFPIKKATKWGLPTFRPAENRFMNKEDFQQTGVRVLRLV